MNDSTKEVLYFKRPGPQNTKRTLAIARRRGAGLGIKRVLVPSTIGKTGLLACQMLPGFEIIVVTHSAGFASPGTQELGRTLRKKIAALGGKILTCQHAFGGVGRAVRKKFGTYELEEVIANSLRVFGQGTKVAIEIALMAADAGLVSPEEEVISLGGTNRGVDTGLVLKPANAQTFFDLKVLEVLCKPRTP